MDIFEPRETIFPVEYSKFELFDSAIRGSYWEEGHFTFDRDVKDWDRLPEIQKEAASNSMLAISVVENKIKTFWARVDMRLPKPEVSDVGFTFAANEVVHQKCYAKLLNILGLHEKFLRIDEVPEMKDRVAYLSKYLKGVSSRSNKEFTKSLILFTLLVENCSLMGQFLTISSFSKYDQKLKNFGKVINATAKDESIHGDFGALLTTTIREENPEWFDGEMEQKIRRAVRKAYRAEEKIQNWVFKKGELPWISKKEILAFLQYRLNDSLLKMGYEKEFEINEANLEKSEYFDNMLSSTLDIDFFDGVSTDYALNKSFDEDSIWD